MSTVAFHFELKFCFSISRWRRFSGKPILSRRKRLLLFGSLKEVQTVQYFKVHVFEKWGCIKHGHAVMRYQPNERVIVRSPILWIQTPRVQSLEE